ncbi:MAG: hypothetical protein M3Y77_17330 [Actinomycetota bacterium]|nr:hypothetical protein [Actinomycetota bacterium]MDQ2848067.1 hypothetical protein [Actinomycetota bacterium]
MTSIFDQLVDPAEPRNHPGVGYELVYRFTDRDGLLTHMLPSKKLRMNSWSRMNDPRETKAWDLTGHWNTAGTLTKAQVHTRVDQLVRRSARLLSTPRDRIRKMKTPGGKVVLFERRSCLKPRGYR